MNASRIERSSKEVEREDYDREITEDEDVDETPRAENRRRFIFSGAWCFGRLAPHNVFPALNKFAKMRNAPGTPAGSSRNQENAVKMYAPLP